MSAFANYLREFKVPQWILVGAGFAFALAALILGVSDNPPGIILMYAGLFCLAGALVYNLPSPRHYWIVLLVSLAAFPVGVVLHNLLYALGTLVEETPVFFGLVGFLHATFFLVAVMVAGPAALAGLIGGVVSSWQGMDRFTARNRSVRRFKGEFRVGEKQLRKLVNLARQSASGSNLQPLKFLLSFSDDRNQLIFPTLSWAGYLRDWQGPGEGERPSAYIIVLGDTELANSFQYDAGIASQSITLGAAEMGLGACLIGSIHRDTLKEALAIPDRYQILLVIALGKPAEIVVLDPADRGAEIKYWRDDQERHHVPKRGIEELILDL